MQNNESVDMRVSYPGVSDRNQSDGFSYVVKPNPIVVTPPLPSSPYQSPVYPQFYPPGIQETQHIPPQYTTPFVPTPLPTASQYPAPALPPKVPNDTQPVELEKPPLPPKPLEYSHDLDTAEETEFAYDHTEGGEPLRKMTIPVCLTEKFLEIAASNTRNNIETCGILTGTLSRNAFSVTTLIIPKQTATSDTCTATNEEEFCEYQDEKGLIMLGWIHTHPTQTCFMSSMDLHTHSSYQMMIPEAIAIVCAPKYNDVGIFRLTSPPGLGKILGCELRGFHPHDDSDIYKDIKEQPSHVVTEKFDLDIVDFR